MNACLHAQVCQDHTEKQHVGESRDILHLYLDGTDKNICHYFCTTR